MPNESRIGPRNELAGKEYKLQCLSCSGQTVHRVVASAEYESDFEDRGFSMTSWNDYQVVECQGCKTLSFRHAQRDTESIDHDPETGEQFLEETVTLYPPRDSGRPQLDNADLLPAQVGAIYVETLAARDASLAVLTGIGLRALVETVCKERATASGNLERRIDALVTQGVLTKDGAEILHSLRIMGNQAAHEVKPHKRDDLDTAFDVIEYVLKGVYILPKLADKLPKRGTT